jgi:hypothetical protein
MPHVDYGRGDPGEAARQIIRRNTTSSYFEVALVLFVGLYFWSTGLQGVSDSKLYNASVTTAVWTFLIGGVVLLAGAILCSIGLWPGLLIDAVANLLIGLLLLASGAIWLVWGDLSGALIGLFGLISMNAARASWSNYQHVRSVLGHLPGASDVDQPNEEPAGAAALTEADMEAKQQALRRLLATKESKTTEVANAPRAEAPRSADIREAKRPASPELREMPDLPRPRRTDEEPAPEGFLADFGRDEDD